MSCVVATRLYPPVAVANKYRSDNFSMRLMTKYKCLQGLRRRSKSGHVPKRALSKQQKKITTHQDLHDQHLVCFLNVT
jgi:hypothetical protein